MDKVFVAQRVANKLVAAEAAVEAACAEASELMSEIIQSRKDLEAHFMFADGAQAKVMEALKALTEARSAMVAAHDELGESKLRLGIRTKLAGVITHVSGAETNPVFMREVG